MSVSDELVKLNDLKNAGLLSEGEFQQQREALLAAQLSPSPKAVSPAQTIEATPAVLPIDVWPTIPLRKKWWFQVIWVLICVPFTLILMACYPSYYRHKNVEIRKVSATNKAIFSVLWLLWMALQLTLI
jgi:hypothetical protein